MTYLDGIIFAESKNYMVEDDYTSSFKSFSVEIDGDYAIAINRNSLEKGEEKTALFHELGHCETNSFYNQYTAFDIQQKHENRADKWAIKKLIPEDELNQAIADGHVEIWDLAEYFGVTEKFMRKAVCLYMNGNLCVEYLG